MILRRLAKTPSLKTCVADPDWFADAWPDGKAKAFEDTRIEDFAEIRAWTVEQILDAAFFPA